MNMKTGNFGGFFTKGAKDEEENICDFRWSLEQKKFRTVSWQL